MLVFCDSVVLIYFLDHEGDLQERSEHRLATLASAGDQIATSDLVRMECRVGPLQRNDDTILSQFDEFFAQPSVLRIPLTAAVLDRAAQIRASYRFETVDSINLATAIEGGCSLFLTNDVQLRRCSDITVEVLH